MNTLAPIVLFVYNRPWHTEQTVTALLKNELADASDLIVYSDAPKNEAAAGKVEEVRRFVKSIRGFRSVTIIERERNWGLADSIIDGVTTAVNKYGRVIVLEDDLVTSTYFLTFMNRALEKYEGFDNVFSITGYSFTEGLKRIDDSYFLKLTSSWGWGTWENKWKHFSRDSEALRRFIDEKNHADFNYGNSYDYVSMAKNQLDGKIDSWAIFWHFSVSCKEGLTLYPAKRLVQNIGFDSSGVHCGTHSGEAPLNPFLPELTDDVQEKANIRDEVRKILKGVHSSFGSKVRERVKCFLKARLSMNQKTALHTLYAKLRLLFLKKKIGPGSFVDKTVHVTGWEHIRIGSNTLVGEYSWLNVNGRIKGEDHIIIGDNCYIGGRSILSSARKLTIRDFLMTGHDCKFLGSDHVYSDPLFPYVSTGATFDTNMYLGVNVWLGASVILLGNIKIGHGSVIGAGSVVTKSIPPFSIAVGNPCKVIRRFDFLAKKWVRLEDFDSTKENLMPDEETYLATLKASAPALKMPLFAATSAKGDLP